MTKSSAQPIPALAAKLLPSAMTVRKATVELSKSRSEFAKIDEALTQALADSEELAIAVLADDGRVYLFGDVDEAQRDLDADEPFSLPFIDGRTERTMVEPSHLFTTPPAPPVDLPAKAAAKKSARRSPGGASVIMPRR